MLTSVYLHRPCFMRALATGDQACELSVRTVVEVCERMLELVKGILGEDQTMSRWFVSVHCGYLANPSHSQPTYSPCSCVKLYS